MPEAIKSKVQELHLPAKVTKQQQQLQQQQKHSNYSFQLQHLNALQLRFKNKYTDISVDKLLSKSSDIPSGLSRLPLD